MNVTLINLKPLGVALTTYDPYVSLIDLTNQTITINKGSSTAYQGFMPDTEITISKEFENPPVNVTAKII